MLWIDLALSYKRKEGYGDDFCVILPSEGTVDLATRLAKVGVYLGLKFYPLNLVPFITGLAECLPADYFINNKDVD